MTGTGFPTPSLTMVGSLPAGVAFTDNGNGTATLAGTPGIGTSGTYPLTETAHNGVGGDATQSLSLVVVRQNHAPAATVTSGFCRDRKRASGTVDLTLTDADGDPLTLALASNSAPRLLPDGNVVIGGHGHLRTLTVTAAAGRSGTATLDLTLSDGKDPTTVVITVVVGSAHGKRLNGTPGDDMILGRAGPNTIDAGPGDDLVCGGDGADTLNGGSGNDILAGGNGNDHLNGGSGNHRLNGGNGDVRLRGGAGDDHLTGGRGADFFSGGPGADTAADFNPRQGDMKDGPLAKLLLSAGAPEVSATPAARGSRPPVPTSRGLRPSRACRRPSGRRRAGRPRSAREASTRSPSAVRRSGSLANVSASLSGGASGSAARRPARAVVERVALAADDARQLLPHPPQPGDAGVDFVDLRRHSHAQRLGRFPAVATLQVLADLGEREADRLCLLDRAQEPHRLRVVAAMAARVPRGRGQQASALEAAERLEVHARACCDLADSHAATIDPYLGTEIKPTRQRIRRAGNVRVWPCRTPK